MLDRLHHIVRYVVCHNYFLSSSVSDTAARQSAIEAVRRSIRKFEEKRYAMMKQRNIIGQVCHTPKSYDNVMHVGLRKVTFKWQRGNKIGMATSLMTSFVRIWVNTHIQSVMVCLCEC